MLPSVYVFPTGELVRLRSGFGWCTDCEHIRQIEKLPSTERLEMEEDALKALARKQPGGLSRYEQMDLEHVGLYRRLLDARQSANRCMTCGGTNTDSWLFDANELATYNPHGGCLGQFSQTEDPDGMRLALVEDAEAYTLEGEHIGRLSQQPGYDGTEDF